jgi:hypothetical protein
MTTALQIEIDRLAFSLQYNVVLINLRNARAISEYCAGRVSLRAVFVDADEGLAFVWLLRLQQKAAEDELS